MLFLKPTILYILIFYNHQTSFPELVLKLKKQLQTSQLHHLFPSMGYNWGNHLLAHNVRMIILEHVNFFELLSPSLDQHTKIPTTPKVFFIGCQQILLLICFTVSCIMTFFATLVTGHLKLFTAFSSFVTRLFAIITCFRTAFTVLSHVTFFATTIT